MNLHSGEKRAICDRVQFADARLSVQLHSYVRCFIGFTFALEIDHFQQGGRRTDSGGGGHSNSFGGAQPANPPPPATGTLMSTTNDLVNVKKNSDSEHLPTWMLGFCLFISALERSGKFCRSSRKAPGPSLCRLPPVPWLWTHGWDAEIWGTRDFLSPGPNWMEELLSALTLFCIKQNKETWKILD